MEIFNNQSRVILSDYVKPDSNVIEGGGIEQSVLIQQILDMAKVWRGLHLIVDGAYLVKTLHVYSNTKIECKNLECGFFLQDFTNDSILQNAHLNLKEILDYNIELIGGTYNLNCKNQLHHIESERTISDNDFYKDMVFGFKFYGVEHIIMRDMILLNQRTYMCSFGNFKNINIENIEIKLPDLMFAQNQDGFHFWGPGQFLTMKNISGTTGDDFIAIAPDEIDGVSSISDVLIDGVHLNHADQGIRILARFKGIADRIVVQNVTGTYSSYGFIVNPWVDSGWKNGDTGYYGTITFNNIDLKQEGKRYDYSKPCLFRVGGDIASLVFNNIIFRNEGTDSDFLQIGGDYVFFENNGRDCRTFIKNIIINGIQIFEGENVKTRGIRIKGQLQNFILSNVISDVSIIEMEEGNIDNMIMSNSICKQQSVIDKEGKIKQFSIK